MIDRAHLRPILFASLGGLTLILNFAGCDPESPQSREYSVVIGADRPPASTDRNNSFNEEPDSRGSFRQNETTRVMKPILTLDELSVSDTAARALSTMGAAAVPELRRALYDPRPAMRIRAADVLADIGPEAKDAAPDLMKVLADPNPGVKKAAIRALGAIGPDARESAATLVKLLENDP